MFWIKKIRPLSGTDIKFRNHPVSSLKQVRFCNVPAYASPVTGSLRENLLINLKRNVRSSFSGMIFKAVPTLHHTSHSSLKTVPLSLLIPFMERLIRFFFISTPRTRTSTISPTLTASSGCLMNFSLISEIWTRPS